MAVEYDVVCRRCDPGAMLAAAFLAVGGCRILVLPERPDRVCNPDFLVPVLKGFPAELISGVAELSSVPDDYLVVGREASETPSQLEKDPWLHLPGGFCGQLPESSYQELVELWGLLDDSMRQGLEMPVSSLQGSGRMLWLVLKNELLRTNRNRKLSDWLVDIASSENSFSGWRALSPLYSLSRFADPPLLSFAYGLTVLDSPEAWLPIHRLEELSLELLRRAGADFVTDAWKPIFDGKWFTGVGCNQQVVRRVTACLADADPVKLFYEVDHSFRRGDFLRQFRMDSPGFLHHSCPTEAQDSSDRKALFQLHCCKDGGVDETIVIGPDSAGEGFLCHRWKALERPVAERREVSGELSVWGGIPRLPAMMGGGFLPLHCGFLRFYQVGWHNLPGFGLGGLVYSAWQAARLIWTHDLQRPAAELVPCRLFSGLKNKKMF